MEKRSASRAQSASDNAIERVMQLPYLARIIIQVELLDYRIISSMQVICGYEFDFSKPVYLLHPQNKFWEISILAETLRFKIGKLKDKDEDCQIVEKQYPNSRTARNTAITKIEQKLIKGYFSKDALKKEEENKPTKSKAGGQAKKVMLMRVFSGEYYEKGDEAIKIEVNGKKVKITRIGADKKERSEIRSMDSNEEAIQFCLKEEKWVKNDGYQAKNHKFIYSFVDDDEPPAEKKPTRKKDTQDSASNNVLSITNMTDQAISHNSREHSVTKSDRSYHDDGSVGSFVSTKLGPPTSACIKVLLAETYQEDTDPIGMIMSEKLDGVRCFWTGSVMYSRNGNRFFCPKFFTKNWPNSQLDGELFIDRGEFSKTLSAVKKNVPIDSEWQRVRYLVFDCPGYKKPFKERIKALKEVIESLDNHYIKCHAHRECTGFPDLFTELDKVNKIQGEGLMLRDPNALYENRRSKSLLKVKTFHDDEATVLGYTEGTGRCYGMVGALKVRNTHGIEFQVGSGLTDDLRRRPPKIGTKITYKYQEFNKDSGKPRFPTYLRAFDDKI